MATKVLRTNDTFITQNLLIYESEISLYLFSFSIYLKNVVWFFSVEVFTYSIITIPKYPIFPDATGNSFFL